MESAIVLENAVSQDVWAAAAKQVRKIPSTYTAGFFRFSSLPEPIHRLIVAMDSCLPALGIEQEDRWNRYTCNVNRAVLPHIDNQTHGYACLALFLQGEVEGGLIKIDEQLIELKPRSLLFARFDLMPHSVTDINLLSPRSYRRSLVAFSGKDLVP